MHAAGTGTQRDFLLTEKTVEMDSGRTVAGALLAFVLSAFILPKKYTSSLDLYVNNRRTGGRQG